MLVFQGFGSQLVMLDGKATVPAAAVGDDGEVKPRASAKERVREMDDEIPF